MLQNLAEKLVACSRLSRLVQCEISVCEQPLHLVHITPESGTRTRTCRCRRSLCCLAEGLSCCPVRGLLCSPVKGLLCCPVGDLMCCLVEGLSCFPMAYERQNIPHGVRNEKLGGLVAVSISLFKNTLLQQRITVCSVFFK
jgi:hypothetical protein